MYDSHDWHFSLQLEKFPPHRTQEVAAATCGVAAAAKENGNQVPVQLRIALELQELSSDQNPGYFLYLGDHMLPSYKGIIKGQLGGAVRPGPARFFCDFGMSEMVRMVRSSSMTRIVPVCTNLRSCGAATNRDRSLDPSGSVRQSTRLPEATDQERCFLAWLKAVLPLLSKLHPINLDNLG